MKLELEGRNKTGPVRMDVDIRNQFDFRGTWLKANFHCHVRRMGGPEKVCRHYRKLGFRVLASTDYAEVTPMPQSFRDFIALAGAEISGFGKAHVVCVGIGEAPVGAVGGAASLDVLVREVEGRGGVAILAHPYSSGFSWEELRDAGRSGVVGFEISNRLSWRINGKGCSEALYEIVLDDGMLPAAVGVDDSHSFEHGVTGRGWTGVLVSEATSEGVLEALRARRSYASEGPQIRSIEVRDEGTIVVGCSPCRVCHFRSRGFGVRSKHSSRPVREFELDLRAEGYRLQDWLYVCLEDRRGRRAWSSAMPVHNRVTRLR